MSTPAIGEASGRLRTLAAWVIVSLALASSARADVDLTGGWEFAPSVTAPTTLPTTIVQSGTSLSVQIGIGAPATGTIDPATGAFSVASAVSGCANISLQGTATMDGNMLSGTGTVDTEVRGCVPVPFTFTAVRVNCGNGVIDPGEGCDDGNRRDDDCCSSTCSPRPSGTPCAGSGEACRVDACDGAGVCMHVLAAAGSVCRPAVDDTCDVAEACDGVSPTCPPDQVRPVGTICRPRSAACDPAEVCTGSSGICPPDITPPDGDGDGIPDPCDACPAGIAASKPHLRIGTYDGVGANDKLQVSAELQVSSATAAFLDPIATGIVILVADPPDAGELTVGVPAGAYDDASRQGWKSSRTGHTWKFRSANPSLAISRATVRLSLDARVPPPRRRRPPHVQVKATGKRRSFAIAMPALPLRLRVVLDPPLATSIACAEASFATPGSPSPRCTLRSRGTLLSCR